MVLAMLQQTAGNHLHLDSEALDKGHHRHPQERSTIIIRDPHRHQAIHILRLKPTAASREIHPGMVATAIMGAMATMAEVTITSEEMKALIGRMMVIGPRAGILAEGAMEIKTNIVVDIRVIGSVNQISID
jgi:hypothetical protein